jgi:hypothetical protein
MAAALDVPNTLESGAPAGGVHLVDKVRDANGSFERLFLTAPSDGSSLTAFSLTALLNGSF